MFTIPEIRPRELEFVRLTVAQAKAMSDAELLAILSGEGSQTGMVTGTLQQLINAELLARGLERARKPHWSAVPSFWLLVISVLLALVGATAGLLAIPQVQKFLFPEPPPAAVNPPAATAPERLPIAPPPSAAAPKGTPKK